MRNAAVVIFLVILFVVLALVFVSFQVRETEYALVTRFGSPFARSPNPASTSSGPLQSNPNTGSTHV